MKITILLVILLSSMVSFAQEDSEELTESEVVLQMFESDMAKDMDQMGLLYNTILSGNASAAEKCKDLSAYDQLLSKINMDLAQYSSLVERNGRESLMSSMFESQISVRQIRAYQMQDRLIALSASSVIFAKNNNCAK